jgi:hypothetical protein
MKYLFFIALIISPVFFSCGSDKTPPPSPPPPPFSPEGKWIAKDIELDFDVDCKCTTEEKQILKSFLKNYVEALKGEYLKNGHIEFFKDKTYKSEFMNETDYGKYEVQNDGNTIKKTDNDKGEKEYLTVVKIEQEMDEDIIELHLKANQSDLEELVFTENVPNFGKITFRIIFMEITFKK